MILFCCHRLFFPPLFLTPAQPTKTGRPGAEFRLCGLGTGPKAFLVSGLPRSTGERDPCVSAWEPDRRRLMSHRGCLLFAAPDAGTSGSFVYRLPLGMQICCKTLTGHTVTLDVVASLPAEDVDLRHVMTSSPKVKVDTLQIVTDLVRR